MKDIKQEIDSIREEHAVLAEQEHKLMQIAKLREEKTELEKRMTVIRGKAFVLKKEAEEASAEVKKYELLLESAHAKAELDKLQSELKCIEAELAKLDPVEATSHNFDKYRCFDNIRELMKKCDIRIGQIETEAHCQPGYMSRLDKPTSNTDPSVEFLVTAAKVLGTNLEILVNGNLAAMTPTEEYLMSLMENLINDTKADKVCWEKETEQKLAHIDFDFRDGSTSHPLFEMYTEVFDEYPEPAGTKYDSRFTPNTEISPAGNCYNAYLPNSGSRIYIMSLLDSDEIEFFYEVYLVDADIDGNYTVDPICSTRETCEPIGKMVDALYKQIEVSSSHVHLNTRARAALEMYMGGGKKEDE